MSGIEYRKRLAERRAAEQAAGGAMSRFVAQHEFTKITPQETAPEIVEAATPAEEYPKEFGFTPQVVTEETAVIPQSPKTPAQAREAARAVAEALIAMTDEEYAQTLSAMREENPTQYAVVVDELNNMQVDRETAENAEFGTIADGEEAIYDTAAGDATDAAATDDVSDGADTFTDEQQGS